MLRNRKIDWELFVLLIIYLFVSSESFMFFSIFYLVILIYRAKGKLSIPKVPGIKLYLLFIVYSVFIGLMLYSVRSVVRDLYYVLSTLIWIFIGTYLAERPKIDRKVLLRTLFLYGGFVSTRSILLLGINKTFDFDVIRLIFGIKIYEIGMIFPIMLYQIYICEEKMFSKKIDLWLMLVMFIQITFSFGRIAILEPLFAIFSIIFLSILFTEKQKKGMKSLVVVIGILIVTIGGLFYILPKSFSNQFLSKISTSFQEIDSSQEIMSIGMAMNNWRAYEIKAAIENWKSSNVFEMIFGGGMGKGIELTYIPYSWGNVLDEGVIPLTHNGFVTLLPKGGIVAVSALALMFIGPVIEGFKHLCNQKKQNSAIILISISVAGIANTWVVRGPVQQGCFLIWALLLGIYTQ